MYFIFHNRGRIYLYGIMILVAASGCRDKRPADWPRLAPCQITVLKDGKEQSENKFGFL